MSSPPPPTSTLREHVAVGHEGSMQGRREQHIGNTMSAVFKDQRINLQFGDFKSSSTAFIGELKVPWVDDHKLSGRSEDELRVIHSWYSYAREKSYRQIAQYMWDLDLTYGFMSTYEQTMFLRQILDPVAGWTL
ncbi:hypothetical protein FE257_012909 [Aspergillus nanangensis]|uniref:Uncharacterized protein n=1 Tax=Aspergillus nanangensis TaxID=2582783 RepID=A0AAD4CFT6_ASPNN|nr:hypothetical protein FE257_012909 [Aspergillus nanangensis]